MIYFPHAKINIGLKILGKREDGFHNIESIFFPVPICDVLEIIPSALFHFQYSGVDHIDGDNLVVKAYQAIKSKVDVPAVTIHLHKNIPIGAGVGGGSSDASFTLKALNKQFELGLDQQTLHEVALSIGSDCPFFLKEEPQHVTGRGETMTPVSLDLKGYQLLIVNAGIHISTKEAYTNLQIPNRENEVSLEEAIHYPLDQWSTYFPNDFEHYAFEKYPLIKEIKEQMLAAGAKFASMTGTGSTVYGIFENGHSLPVFSEEFLYKAIQL